MDLPLLPARMVNELSYCPRLFFLEWVDTEFEDNHFTVDGRFAHRRVDAKEGSLPEPTETPFKVRRIALSSETLGVSAAIDVVESDGAFVMPVDFKRGAVPPGGAFEPERVQLCLYGLLLREHGHQVEQGVLYFVGSKTRVEVPLDDALIARTMELVAQAKQLATQTEPPPPLVASPKCNGCSLSAICLPDEVTLLAGNKVEVRGLVPSRDDAAALYVQEQGAKVGISGSTLVVRNRDGLTLTEAPLVDVGQLVLWGNAQVSSQALRELSLRGVNVAWLSFGGWLSAMVDGIGHGNVSLRRAQYRVADDAAKALAISRSFVASKILNARTFLRRNHDDGLMGPMLELAQFAERAEQAESRETLLGLEGNAARIYFSLFDGLLRPREGNVPAFDFESRSRRPPKDPINALLSLAYSLLAKDVAFAARLVGLDPFVGFLHQPRHGRMALALDVMEAFRPLIADSVVVNAVNTGVVGSADFVRAGAGVMLTTEGRKRFLKAYERRISEHVTHPVFGYRISYRRVLEVQCRLLSRYLIGEIPEVPQFRTR